MTRRRFLLYSISTLIVICVESGPLRAANISELQLHVGDHIAILGNGLADRMQHTGWLETYLQARYPDHQLVVRNLGFTGDELTERMRSDGFGSPEDWLKRTKATVVFAFFGFNESFQDRAGLTKFESDLTNFISQIRSTEVEGRTVRQLVLFSPIAYEGLNDPLLPPSDDANRRLGAYARVLDEVAKRANVPFVDLFHPTKLAYQKSSSPFTINGVHLNDYGNKCVARMIDQGLFGPFKSSQTVDLERLREAVQDKNFVWFQRYRTTDGYSIFGDRRSAGESPTTPSNRVVMEREMEVLDVMTANRDRRIWSLAKGQDGAADDSNTPPLIPVATNMAGPLEEGRHPFLRGEEAIEKMVVADGMTINLFASEEQFPDLQNPVQAAVDTRGRLWVAAWPSYPHWNPKQELNDKLLILEDVDKDGKADRCQVFADGLHNPTGFEFYNGGVYLAQVPDIWFLKDTDGDDRADVRTRVLGGIDSADTHHSINSFVLGPGGGLYFQEGVFHRTQVETPFRGPVRVADAGVFRYDPRSQEFSAYANYGFANPHGHVFTYWGDDIVHDGTSATPYFGPAISGRVEHPAKHRDGPNIYPQKTRPCAATAVLSSRHFPDENRDTLLVCNVIGIQGILQYRLEESGAGLQGVEMNPLVVSSDPNFRPVDLEVGSDGAVYLLDWQNPLIGHLQHNLRDANRDHRHGRVYRIQCGDRDLIEPVAIADQPLEKLLPLLTERDNHVRYRAKIELSQHPTDQVMAACIRWLDSLNSTDPNFEHHLMEALWLHQHHHVVNEPLLRRLLSSENHSVRAAAAGVLRAWRVKIPDVDDLVENLVRDESPRVRLSGILICSDMDNSRSAELALETTRFKLDRFLEYTLREALETLKPAWRQALIEGKPFCDDNPQGIQYLVREGNPAELVEICRDPRLLEAVLWSKDTTPAVGRMALGKLAELNGSRPVALLLEFIEQKDAVEANDLGPVTRLLKGFDLESLVAAESPLLRLAKESRNSQVREAALAAIVRIDQSIDRAWQLALATADGPVHFMRCASQIPERPIRALFFDRTHSLIVDSESLGASFSGEDERRRIVSAGLAALAHIPGHEREKLECGILSAENPAFRDDALAMIRTIPSTHWRESDAIRLTSLAIQRALALSPTERLSKGVARELELALDFAKLLPEDSQEDVQSQLSQLLPQKLKLGTIRHRMFYDRQRLVARAGGTVQLIFENSDNMPHDFVLIKPGGLTRVGLLSEAPPKPAGRGAGGETAGETGGEEGSLSSPLILLASRLLQPGETQELVFQAPETPGVYPFICSYPGHWRRMYGAFVVVEHVPQYEEAPEAYLASHSIDVQDEQLKSNRPQREWTLEELAPALESLSDGRSFQRGSELFRDASCAGCHSVSGRESRFAPDLAQLDPRRTPQEILQDILHPSHRIDEKFRTSQFVLNSGQVHLGVVIQESTDTVALIVDPRATCEPITIDKSEIEERQLSRISMMPTGLLDQLTEDEILELCAYVVSRGKSDADVYTREH